VDGRDTRAAVVAGVLERVFGLWLFEGSVFECQERVSFSFPQNLERKKEKKTRETEKKSYHTRRGRAGDDLEGLDDAGHNFVLEARVLAWCGGKRRENNDK